MRLDMSIILSDDVSIILSRENHGIRQHFLILLLHTYLLHTHLLHTQYICIIIYYCILSEDVRIMALDNIFLYYYFLYYYYQTTSSYTITITIMALGNIFLYYYCMHIYCIHIDCIHIDCIHIYCIHSKYVLLYIIAYIFIAINMYAIINNNTYILPPVCNKHVSNIQRGAASPSSTSILSIIVLGNSQYTEYHSIRCHIRHHDTKLL